MLSCNIGNYLIKCQSEGYIINLFIWPPQKYSFGVPLIYDIRKKVVGPKKMTYVEKTLNALKSVFPSRHLPAQS